MCLQNKETDDLTRIFGKNVLYRKEIILGLAHLLIMDRNKAVMQPIPRKTAVTADAGLRLGNLVLMMREDQVASAAMEVEGFPQVFQ